MSPDGVLRSVGEGYFGRYDECCRRYERHGEDDIMD